MARTRQIKPSFFTNEDLVECDVWSRLLFIGLWGIADREGRLADRPKRIKMQLFPADDVNVEGCLAELAGAGFIHRYEVDGERFVQIVNFTKHQSPHHKETPSTIPDRDGALSHPGSPASSTGPVPDIDPSDGDEAPNSDPMQGAEAPDMSGTSHGQAALVTRARARTRNQENDPPPPPEGDTAGATESAGKGKPETPYRFQEFWEPWPKKVGRKQTVEQWKRLQLDDATIDAIVAALPVHAAGDKWRRGYIQEPHRWIRDRRWEDEVEPFQAETSLTVNGSDPSTGGRPPRPGMTLVAGRWMDLTRLAAEDIRHIGTFQGEDEAFRATLDRLTGQPAPPGQPPPHPFDDLDATGHPSGVIDVAFSARSSP